VSRNYSELWTGTTDSSLFVLAGSDQLPRNIPIRIRRLAPALAEPTAGTTTAPPGTSTARVLPGSGNEPSSWGPPIGLIASDLTAVVTTINDRPVRLAYQPPTSSTFLSEQTSRQQPANSTFLSEQMDIAIQNSLGGKKKNTHTQIHGTQPPTPPKGRARSGGEWPWPTRRHPTARLAGDTTVHHHIAARPSQSCCCPLVTPARVNPPCVRAPLMSDDRHQVGGKRPSRAQAIFAESHRKPIGTPRRPCPSLPGTFLARCGGAAPATTYGGHIEQSSNDRSAARSY
jgi:hypothetical protein